MSMQVESPHDENTWHSVSASTLKVRKLRRSARWMGALQHNKSLNPTRDSMAFMISAGGVD